MRARIAVLASGGGSNLQAILDHFAMLGERAHGEVALVASDRADARALERGWARVIPSFALRTKRNPDGALLDELLAAHDIDLVALAGYLRLVPESVVRRYEGRIVNVHPALLPAFGGKGMFGHHVHEAVVAAGVTVTGVTVHYVDEEFDRGTIIAQWPVPVLAGDDADAVAARVLRVEHLLYPRVLDAVAGGRFTAAHCRTHRAFVAPADAAFAISPALSTTELGDMIDRTLQPARPDA